MVKILASGRLDLTDLSDAIISGTQPSSTKQGQLWIDNSTTPPVLKIFDDGEWRVLHLDVLKMDEAFKKTIEKVIETLGSITNDGILNHSDRITLGNEINRIIGHISSTKETNNFPDGLPDIEWLLTRGKGTLATSLKTANRLGINEHSPEYSNLVEKYEALRSYLNNLDTFKPWDITNTHVNDNIQANGDDFRAKWLDYYNAALNLDTEILSVPGPAGKSAVNMILTNELITVSETDDGEDILDLATTDIMIFEGSTNVSRDWSYRLEYDNENLQLNFNDEEKKTITLTSVNWSQDIFNVNIIATREGFPTITKTLTIQRVKTGKSAILEWMKVSNVTIKKDSQGNFIPETITITPSRRVGGGEVSTFPVKFEVTYSTKGGGTGTLVSRKTASSEVLTINLNEHKNKELVTITVVMYSEGNIEIDRQTCIIVEDGLNAENPIILTADNDTIVIMTDYQGHLYPDSLEGASVSFTAYSGRGFISLTSPNSDYSINFIPDNGISGQKYVKESNSKQSYKITSMTVDRGKVVASITDRGGRILDERVINVIKSRSGAPGEDAVSRFTSVPNVITINLDRENNKSFSPRNISVRSVVINNGRATVDDSVTRIKFTAENLLNGELTDLTELEHPASISTSNLLGMIAGSDVDYRTYRIKVEAIRATNLGDIDTEYIEIISDGYNPVKNKDYFDGINGYSLTLSNENHTFVGVTGHAEPGVVTTELFGYQGVDRRTTKVGEITGIPLRGVRTEVLSNNTTSTSIRITVDENLTDENVVLVIPVTVDNKVRFIKNFTITYTQKIDGVEEVLIKDKTELLQSSGYIYTDKGDANGFIEFEFDSYNKATSPGVQPTFLSPVKWISPFDYPSNLGKAKGYPEDETLRMGFVVSASPKKNNWIKKKELSSYPTDKNYISMKFNRLDLLAGYVDSTKKNIIRFNQERNSIMIEGVNGLIKRNTFQALKYFEGDSGRSIEFQESNNGLNVIFKFKQHISEGYEIFSSNIFRVSNQNPMVKTEVEVGSIFYDRSVDKNHFYVSIAKTDLDRRYREISRGSSTPDWKTKLHEIYKASDFEWYYMYRDSSNRNSIYLNNKDLITDGDRNREWYPFAAKTFKGENWLYFEAFDKNREMEELVTNINIRGTFKSKGWYDKFVTEVRLKGMDVDTDRLTKFGDKLLNNTLAILADGFIDSKEIDGFKTSLESMEAMHENVESRFKKIKEKLLESNSSELFNTLDGLHSIYLSSYTTAITPLKEVIDEESNVLSAKMRDSIDISIDDLIDREDYNGKFFDDERRTKRHGEIASKIKLYKQSLKELLESLENSILGYTDKTIGDLKITDYMKKAEWVNEKDNITFNITNAGGNNYIKNSTFFKWGTNEGENFWININGNNELATRINSTSLEKIGLGAGLYVNAESDHYEITQRVAVKANQKYSMNAFIHKIISSGIVSVTVLDGGTTKVWEYSIPEGRSNSDFEDKSGLFNTGFTVENSFVTIKVLVSNTRANIAGLMLKLGETISNWTPHPEEVYNSNVRFDSNGIMVYHTDGGTVDDRTPFTRITPTEFAGYSYNKKAGKHEKAFYMSGNETNVTNLRVHESMTFHHLPREIVDAIDGAVDDLAVGSVNLITKSDPNDYDLGNWIAVRGSSLELDTREKFEGTKTIKANLRGNYEISLRNPITVEAGKFYVFSTWIYSSNVIEPTKGYPIDFSQDDYQYIRSSGSIPPEKWTRFSVVIKTGASSTGFLPIKPIFKGNSNGSFNFYKPQLELGNKPTQWKQAEEDMEDKVSKLVKETVIEYYHSDSDTRLVGGSWSTTSPRYVKGKYIFQRIKVTKNDGTVSYKPNENGTNVSGKDGEDGRTVRVFNTNYQYTQHFIDTYSALNYTDDWNVNASTEGVKVGDIIYLTMLNTDTNRVATILCEVKSVNNSSWLKLRSLALFERGRDGSDGTPGTPGADGRTPYFHTAYANSPNGVADFSVTDFEGKAYLGTLTDYNQADSTNPADYNWQRIKGEDGVGISDVEIKYIKSDNGTTPPNDWYDNPPQLENGDYLWTKVIYHLRGGEIRYHNASYQYDGNSTDFIPSHTGKTIVGKETTYVQSGGSSIPKTSRAWSSNSFHVPRGHYIFTKTKWIYSEGEPDYTYSVSNFRDSAINIDRIDVVYTKSNNGTIEPVFWSNTPPQLEAGDYLWTKTKFNMTNGELKESFSVSHIGTDGNDGDDGVPGKAGVSITSTTSTFKVSNNGVTHPNPDDPGWQVAPPEARPGDYLWTKTTWRYSDSSVENTYTVTRFGADGRDGQPGADGSRIFTRKDPSMRIGIDQWLNADGNFGPIAKFLDNGKIEYIPRINIKGPKGDKGDNGVGIHSVEIKYLLKDGSSSIPDDSENWLEDPPETTPGKYLWTRTTLHLTSGANRKSYSVAYIGTNGNDGNDGTPGVDGKGIERSFTAYAIKYRKGEKPGDNEWQETIPEIPKIGGAYLWTQTTWVYTDGETEKSNTVTYTPYAINPQPVVKYSISDSGTDSPVDDDISWSSTPDIVPGKYLWTKNEFSDYGEESSIVTKSVTYIGTNGRDGRDGNDGVPGKAGVSVTSTSNQYMISNDGVNHPNANDPSWQNTVPTVEPGDYLWNKTIWTYSDQTQENTYNVTRFGADGRQGNDGVGISSVNVHYIVSTNGAQHPADSDRGWVVEPPTVPAGKYLWTRTTINLTVGQPTKSYSVSYVGLDGNDGNDGVPGAKGRSIVSSETTYVQGGAPEIPKTSPAWAKEPPSVPPGHYLFTRTKWIYDEGEPEYSYTVSRFGADGRQGSDGKGVRSTTIQYTTSDSGTARPVNGWRSTIPEAQPGQYLWTKTTWVYTDGQTEDSYSVSYMGQDGGEGSTIKNYIVGGSIEYLIASNFGERGALRDSLYNYRVHPDFIKEFTGGDHFTLSMEFKIFGYDQDVRKWRDDNTTQRIWLELKYVDNTNRTHTIKAEHKYNPSNNYTVWNRIEQTFKIPDGITIKEVVRFDIIRRFTGEVHYKNVLLNKGKKSIDFVPNILDTNSNSNKNLLLSSDFSSNTTFEVNPSLAGRVLIQPNYLEDSAISAPVNDAETWHEMTIDGLLLEPGKTYTFSVDVEGKQGKKFYCIGRRYKLTGERLSGPKDDFYIIRYIDNDNPRHFVKFHIPQIPRTDTPLNTPNELRILLSYSGGERVVYRRPMLVEGVYGQTPYLPSEGNISSAGSSSKNLLKNGNFNNFTEYDLSTTPFISKGLIREYFRKTKDPENWEIKVSRDGSLFVSYDTAYIDDDVTINGEKVKEVVLVFEETEEMHHHNHKFKKVIRQNLTEFNRREDLKPGLYTLSFDMFVTDNLVDKMDFELVTEDENGNYRRVIDTRSNTMLKTLAWKRYNQMIEILEEIPSNRQLYLEISAGKFHTHGKLYMKAINLERGLNRETKWVPHYLEEFAPINEKINSSNSALGNLGVNLYDLTNTVLSIQENINTLPSSIVVQRLQKEFDEFRRSYNVVKQQDEENLRVLLNRSNAITNLMGETGERWSFINTHIKMGEEGLVIGDDSSGNYVMVSSNKLQFFSGGLAAAKLQAGEFVFERGVITENFRMLNLQMHRGNKPGHVSISLLNER